MAFADGNIIIGTSVDVGGLNTGLAKIQRSFGRLGRLASLALGVNALYKFGKAAVDAASDLQEVQNIVDVAFEDMAYKIEGFSKVSIERFGMTEFAAKKTAGSFMAMGKSMGLTLDEASSMAVKLTGLTGDFASFYNISQEYAKVALSAVYTGETETLKRYGIILTEANLQEYASTLGITKKVKAMSAREKAIIRYKYILQATTDMEGDFVRTEKNWANQVRVLQQRWNEFLIVLGNGAITVLSPLLGLLNRLIEASMQFAKVLGAALANIFNIKVQSIVEEMQKLKETDEDIAASEDELTDSINNSAKAAKKALAPFDELNVIRQQDSGTSNTALEFDTSDLAIEDYSALNEIVEEVTSNIRTLYELGYFLGQKVKGILDSITWESIFNKVHNFGAELANFLNGQIDSGALASIGTTIAGALNSIIYSALAFGTTFDWKGLGAAFAESINNFLADLDTGELANTIDAFVQGFWDFLVTAFNNLDKQLLWDKILSFFKGLDKETIAILVRLGLGIKLGSLATKLISSLGSLVVKLIATSFTDVGTAILNGLQFVFSNLGSWLGTALSTIGGLIRTALSTLGSWLINGLRTVITFVSSNIATIGKVLGGVGSIIAGLIIAISSFVDSWKSGFNIVKLVVKDFGIALVAIGAVILGVVSGPVAAAIAAIVAGVSSLVLIIKDNWDSVVELGQSLFNDLKNIFGGIYDFIYGIFTLDLPQAANGFISLVEGIINLVANMISGVLNLIIDALNLVDFDLPEFLGGAHVGFNIPKFKYEPLKLPRLATGAVIPPNHEFAAILGDQRHGTNVEAPLDTIKQAVAEVLQSMGGTNTGDVVVQIDGREVFRAVREQNNSFIRRTGYSAFEY